MKSVRKIVKIADLQTNLFVRHALDQDHALMLGQLIEASVKLPPILITKDGKVLDGRHRIAGYDVNGILEVEADVVDAPSEVEQIKIAYRANLGGSLPPTKQDTEHTILLLLEHGEIIKNIAAILKLPPSLARIYVNQVKSKANRAKVMRAVDSVAEGGLTLADAAEKHGVDKDKLKEVMGGRRKKPKNGIEELDHKLTSVFKSFGSTSAKSLKSLIEKYEDGDVSAKQVEEVFDHIEKWQKQSARNVNDWKSRFEAVKDKADKKSA